MQGCDLLLDFHSVPEVVGVQERHELRAGFPDTSVARRGDFGIRLVDQAHALICFGECLNNRRSVVGRTVVDHNDVEVSVRLIGNGA